MADDSMDLFPDGTHVRLRFRNNMYLYAMADGLAVSRSRSRTSLNAAWAVHRVLRDGTPYFLLQSAAYGRYLALRTINTAPASRRVCRLLLCRYKNLDRNDVLWQALWLSEEGKDEVLLRNQKYNIWRWRSPGDTEEPRGWVVEAIPQRLFAPHLPEDVEAPQQPPVRRNGGRIYAGQNEFRRRIRYIRADSFDSILEANWRVLWFHGRSVFQLRENLAAELKVPRSQSQDITLCVRAGAFGRPIPLVVSLPSNQSTMEIIVLTTESPAAAGLRYANMDATAPAP